MVKCSITRSIKKKKTVFPFFSINDFGKYKHCSKMNLEVLAPVATKNKKLASRDRMEVDDNNIHVVNPGEIVTTDQKFMRGHGTYTDGESTVYASVAGTVNRVNQLLSVKPLRARYTPEIGDIVVGRITEVTIKRWKVDVNSRQDANLLLSSVSLPGGVQRRKNEADELQMRQFFSEGDVLVAEVQAFYGDGTMGLHTRGFKVCKLRNGSLVSVPAILVQRCKSQFHFLPCGVNLILGLNGYIWVHKRFEGMEKDDTDMTVSYSSENDTLTEDERQNIARVCNCISALAKQYMHINDTIIVYTYEASLKYAVKDLLKLDVIESITTEASMRIKQT